MEMPVVDLDLEREDLSCVSALVYAPSRRELQEDGD